MFELQNGLQNSQLMLPSGCRAVGASRARASRGDRSAEPKQNAKSKPRHREDDEGGTDNDDGDDDGQPAAELDNDFESDGTAETDSDSDAEMAPPTKARAAPAKPRGKKVMRAPARKRGIASLACKSHKFEFPFPRGLWM